MDTEKKVLISIDLNFETSYILMQAVSFFREGSAKFYILHVVPSDFFSVVNQKNNIQAEMNRSVKVIEDELKKSGLYYLNYEIFISHGVPSAEILNFAKKKGLDIIALGTHQRIGFKEFISGSVSFSVAKNSVCPVLLIPLKSLIKMDNKELAAESAVSLANP